MFIEEWSFSPAEAAEIVGISEAQLGNWYDRYGLFPEMQRGRGIPVLYGFRHLMQFGAVKALVDAGISPARAAEALRHHSTLGAFLHNGTSFSKYPGTMAFTRNEDGRWVGVDSPNREVCIEVRTFPIFDRIYPAAKDLVLGCPARYRIDADEAARRVAEMDAWIAKHREDRGA